MKSIKKLLSIFLFLPLAGISCSTSSANVHIEMKNDNFKKGASDGVMLEQPMISNASVQSSFLINASFPTLIPEKIIEKTWNSLKGHNVVTNNFSITLKKKINNHIGMGWENEGYSYKEYKFSLQPHELFDLENLKRASKGKTLETRTRTLLIGIPFIDKMESNSAEVVIPTHVGQEILVDQEFCENISTKIINFRNENQNNYETLSTIKIRHIDIDKVNSMHIGSSSIIKEEIHTLPMALKQNFITPWEIGNLLNVNFNRFYLPEAQQMFIDWKKNITTTFTAAQLKSKFSSVNSNTTFRLTDLGLQPLSLPSSVSMVINHLAYKEWPNDDDPNILDKHLSFMVALSEQNNPDHYSTYIDMIVS